MTQRVRMAAEGFAGMSLLQDIGVIILVSTIFAFFARALKQPLILAYVLAGIVVGPHGPFPIITSESIITALATLGVAFLLFMVGLELDINRLRDVGSVSAGCGLGQIIITFIFGFLLAGFLGFSQIESFYIAFALTISSTMIVVKLLSDKGELYTLHGKIALGTLLIQDLVTIMTLAILTTLEVERGGINISVSALIVSIITGFGLVFIAIISGKYILPPFLRFAAKTVELLFLTSLAWCFAFSAFSYLAFFHILNFEVTSSISIGAFLAGVSLASFPYNLEIVGRVRSLKDFFVTIFFVSLGMEVVLGNSPVHEIVIFSLFVLIVTPLLMMTISSLFGYGKRTSLLTALSLAQISEFSFILATEGLLLGHITHEVFSLIVWIALITITISSYFIIHGDQIYRRILPYLKIFGKISKGKELEDIPKKSRSHVIVFGCHRMGNVIIKTLQAMRKNFLIVDLDPDVIKSLIEQRIPAIYGDIGDMEILEKINLKDADMVISTIPSLNDNLLVIKETKRYNQDALIIITAESIENALTLYKAGSDYVILPNMLGGERVSDFLTEYMLNKERFKSLKKKHILQLEDQKRLELLTRYKSSLFRSLGKRFENRRR